MHNLKKSLNPCWYFLRKIQSRFLQHQFADITHSMSDYISYIATTNQGRLFFVPLSPCQQVFSNKSYFSCPLQWSRSHFLQISRAVESIIGTQMISKIIFHSITDEAYLKLNSFYWSRYRSTGGCFWTQTNKTSIKLI